MSLQSNTMVIADALETPFQVGGVSYEKMAFTPSWGVEFDLKIDGNVIQQQIFAMAISSSWTKVGFSDLIEVPMVAIWRDPGAVVNTNDIRVIVYHSLADIQTLAQTAKMGGLQDNSWYRVRLWLDEDRLVRVFINDTFVFQYWLPEQYAAGPNRRALNILNQTTNQAYIHNFMLYDKKSDLQTKIQWTREAFYDDFNRANGSVGNGWTTYGNAGIVSNAWLGSTGSNSAGILRDTGVTHGAHRVEGIIQSPSSSADCSLVCRAKSDGSEGLVANFYNGGIYLSRFSGGLTNPTFFDFNYRAYTVTGGMKVALCANGEAAWVEIDGRIVVMGHMNGSVPATQTYAGARVKPGSGSWDDIRIKTAF
ncbi:hypothetical protein ACFXG4_23335 [Nocardia sp. NPDC059246]|uniref:hypothetical protein n=1 Tax=unclassified Nocardia TaxID=2637762 RepID=UPI0036C618DF